MIALFYKLAGQDVYGFSITHNIDGDPFLIFNLLLCQEYSLGIVPHVYTF